MLSEDKATIEERLANATNNSNLVPTRMDDDGGRIGTLEILTAAGWTSKTVEYAIGRNLIALHSEWDGAEHPRAAAA